MAYPVKKIYRHGSPGSLRAESKTSLTRIKKTIVSETALRREYQRRGLLGSRPNG